MLGSKIYIDITKYSFNECSSRLQKELKNYQTSSETTAATVINSNLIEKKNFVSDSFVS